MKSSRKYILAIIALAIVVVAVFIALRPTNEAGVAQGDDRQPESEYRGLKAELKRDSLCEVMVELGSVAYSTTAEKNIRFTNHTKNPVILLDYTSTCKCTWLELPDKPINPGQSADARLYFDSRGEYGSIGNHLSVRCSDKRVNVAIWVSAEVE